MTLRKAVARLLPAGIMHPTLAGAAWLVGILPHEKGFWYAPIRRRRLLRRGSGSAVQNERFTA